MKLRASVLLVAAVLAGLSIALGRETVRAQGGPTVKITSPANGANANNPVTVTVQTSGAVIKAATDGDPNAAHLHYFIDRDPASVLRPGEPIPTGQADIIHTPDTTEQLPPLSPGRHTVWVVLAHTDHTPYSPNVQDQVSFTIGGGEQQAAAAPQATGGTQQAAPQMPVSGRGGLLSATGPHGVGIVRFVGTVAEGPAGVIGLAAAAAGALLAAAALLAALRRTWI